MERLEYGSHRKGCVEFYSWVSVYCVQTDVSSRSTSFRATVVSLAKRLIIDWKHNVHKFNLSVLSCDFVVLWFSRHTHTLKAINSPQLVLVKLQNKINIFKLLCWFNVFKTLQRTWIETEKNIPLMNFIELQLLVLLN